MDVQPRDGDHAQLQKMVGKMDRDEVIRVRRLIRSWPLNTGWAFDEEAGLVQAKGGADEDIVHFGAATW